MKDGWFVSVLVFSIFTFAIGLAIGLQGGDGIGAGRVSRQAIEAGVAEYVVDGKTGETRFVFKGGK